MLLLGFVLLLVLALRLALGPAQAWRPVPLLLAALGGGVLYVMASSLTAPSPARLRGAPARNETSLYVTSAACLGCHPAEHASFSRTFHRTMTQAATDASVLAPFERRDGAVWAEGRKIAQTTGSHREQAYWLEGDHDGELLLLPKVWMIREGQLLPRESAFLTPPDQPLAASHWRSNCITCHAVAGEPGRRGQRFEPKVAELGIACEACHGPGAAHVTRHRSPVERWLQARSTKADPTIVHPARLSAERSLAVCGQCHAYSYPRDEAEFWQHGYARVFRAGDTLAASRHLLSLAALAGDDRPADAPWLEAEARSIFWSDGAIRIGGRELHGVLASACHLRAAPEQAMTCLSCHAMHDGDPRGQIAPSKLGDAGCTSCHTSTEEHSHHPTTARVACVDCHMPKTSFALLSAVRSHKIDSPSAASTLDTHRPNACNLCHVDRSLGWTQRWLREWYQQPELELPAQRHAVAEGAFGGLAADAGVRALYADALGSDAAGRASSAGFPAAVLARMQHDPYAAVRVIAERSLRRVPAAPALPEPEWRALLEQRDERPITLAE